MASQSSGWRTSLNVSYPALPRQRCDVCIADDESFWAIEVKLLRLMGDNGKPNDNMLMHVLSPYPQHRSALTDCAKLAASGFPGRKAIIIYGYEHPDWPLAEAIRCFEVLARSQWRLSSGHSAKAVSLVHPVHSSAEVFGWELLEVTRRSEPR
jgi:hypothetical protein